MPIGASRIPGEEEVGVVSQRRFVGSTRVMLVVATIAGMLATTGAGPAVGADEPAIEILSNRADLISGGNALVEVVLPDGTDPTQVAIDVDGVDVTEAFAVRPDGRFLGLVTELAEGSNALTARLPDGRGATIEIVNHPIGGPVFSGAQVKHWRCTTEDNGLGAPVDEKCNAAAPVYEFFYMPSDGGGFAPYDPEAPPDDVGDDDDRPWRDRAVHHPPGDGHAEPGHLPDRSPRTIPLSRGNRGPRRRGGTTSSSIPLERAAGPISRKETRRTFRMRPR